MHQHAVDIADYILDGHELQRFVIIRYYKERINFPGKRCSNVPLSMARLTKAKCADSRTVIQRGRTTGKFLRNAFNAAY